MKQTNQKRLVDHKAGDNLIISGILSNDLTWQSLRFGIHEGSKITLLKKIPDGPIIIAKNHLEIAIGYDLACQIIVELNEKQ